ncbi:hypothetical protein DCK33_08225 [Listeria monocytogenes]|uniref:DUF3310 domain-containing protein n=2 Tax=Listeria monocytogenes TaxID=1639 RepID=A0A6C8MZ58_LISMN|nr:hypothetical protein DCK33_08225 [Listeria monocytogenes]KAA9541520.1 hypothetical protein DCK32_10240 [Listeria monocytogenes]
MKVKQGGMIRNIPSAREQIGPTLKFNPSNKNTPKPPHERRNSMKHESTVINTRNVEPPHKKGTTDYSSKAVSERLSKGMDNINHPTHYNQGGIETLDYIKAKTPHYESYAIGNIIKYVSRYQHKNGLEDLKKAQFYLNDLVEEMEKNE